MDGVITRIGSTDFNPLGAAINYELDAIIGDRAFGAQAEEMFLADLERSREVTHKPSRLTQAITSARRVAGGR